MENNNANIIDQDMQLSIRDEKDIVTDLLAIHQFVMCSNWLGTVRNRPLKRQAGGATFHKVHCSHFWGIWG